MATERLSMRQTREILRQKWSLRRTHREVAQSLGISSGAVGTTVLRARAAGLAWVQVEALSDEALHARVYGPPTPPTRHRPVPDGAYLHAERRKPGVTQVWTESRPPSAVDCGRSDTLNSGGLLPKTGEYPWRNDVQLDREPSRRPAVARVCRGSRPARRCSSAILGRVVPSGNDTPRVGRFRGLRESDPPARRPPTARRDS